MGFISGMRDQGRRRTGAAALAIMLCLGSSAPHAADTGDISLRDAISAYRSGKHAKAYRGFSKLAANGDAIAQYNLGVMFLTGQGVKKNRRRSVKLHRKAAEQGLAVAQHGLAILYYRGQGVRRSYAKAGKWFRAAAEQGYPDAQFNLGVMHFNGQGVARDMVEVVKWISLAAGKGHKDALYRLATMYEHGEPFKEDPNEALNWYKKAAARGHKEAAKRVAALSDRLGPGKGKGARGSDSTTPKPRTRPVTPTPVPPIAIRSDGGGRKPAPGVRNSAADWTVQLASFRTVEEVNIAWKTLSRRHKALFAELEPTVRKVELGEKGVYHRLHAGPLDDKAAARTFCKRLRERESDQGCFPIPPKSR